MPAPGLGKSVALRILAEDGTKGILRDILQAGKHRPDRFGNADERPIALNPIGDTLSHGLDPDVVGELVLDGIRENQFYIFTDPGMEKQIDRLFDRIKLGFAWARNNEHLKAAKQAGLVWRTR